jgi:putative hydrolases of HD superfamily
VTARLQAQFAFLTEADRLKQILRATTLADGSRRENSGEHSWHIALYAMVLADQAGPEVRIDRVLRMLILHDLVEIDAGDAPIHGNHDPALQAEAEVRAADRIFGLLPTDLAAEFRALWEEFEAAATPDAIFAKSIDRVQPVIQNLESGGGTWIGYDVTAEQLEARVGTKVARGAPALWDHVKARTRDFFDR